MHPKQVRDHVTCKVTHAHGPKTHEVDTGPKVKRRQDVETDPSRFYLANPILVANMSDQLDHLTEFFFKQFARVIIK